ncbi:MAG: hypothetical protein M5R36_16210 [Deltaproteobacteria bacterium]|nr:hypothetical protein [Deltaproteobacteria bacterium]
MVRVELVADRDAVVAGEASRLGVHFVLEEGIACLLDESRTRDSDDGAMDGTGRIHRGATQYPALIYFGAGMGARRLRLRARGVVFAEGGGARKFVRRRRDAYRGS